MNWVKRGCCWQWAVGGLGSGTRKQFCGKWFKDKLLGLFHCLPRSTREGFLLFSFMAHGQHIILGLPTVPQKLLLVPLSIPLEAAAVEPVHLKWCQSDTLPLDSPPLDEHVVDW